MPNKVEFPKKEVERDGVKITHPAFGMIGLSAISHGGGGAYLHGSSIRHNNYLELTIKEGEHSESLGRTWYSGKRGLIKVKISGNQLADLLTSMNHGDGVPCTISYFNGEYRPQIGNLDTPQTEMTDYVQRLIDKALGDAQVLVSKAQEMCKNTAGIKKADKEALLGIICQLEHAVTSNMPYVAKCMDEKMEHTVTEAKGAVEAFVNNKIASLGLQALVDNGEFRAPQIGCIEIPIEHEDHS